MVPGNTKSTSFKSNNKVLQFFVLNHEIIILAGLSGKAEMVLTESYSTRDHTEKMISFYSPNSVQSMGKEITINPSGLEIKNMEIPGDISKASFLIAYACLMPESDIIFENILINPRRMGFINTLKRMGASIAINNKNLKYGELSIR